MQNLNPQRKAFLDMLAWSEGTDNGRQPTRNHGYDVIVGGELFTDYSDHPRKLVTLHPKLKSTAAGRYQLLSRWWDAYRKQLGLKDFSPKSQDAVALQQIKERGALPMIDRGDIRQAIGHMKGVKPPFLIMHGSKDTLVSPEQSAKLFRMLKKNGDNAEYVLVEGAEHGDKTWYQPIIINRVVEWFTKNLGAPIKTAPQQQNPNANL